MGILCLGVLFESTFGVGGSFKLEVTFTVLCDSVSFFASFVLLRIGEEHIDFAG